MMKPVSAAARGGAASAFAQSIGQIDRDILHAGTSPKMSAVAADSRIANPSTLPSRAMLYNLGTSLGIRRRLARSNTKDTGRRGPPQGKKQAPRSEVAA